MISVLRGLISRNKSPELRGNPVNQDIKRGFRTHNTDSCQPEVPSTLSLVSPHAQIITLHLWFSISEWFYFIFTSLSKLSFPLLPYYYMDSQQAMRSFTVKNDFSEE